MDYNYIYKKNVIKENNMFENTKIVLNEKEQELISGIEKEENKELEIKENEITEYFFVEKEQNHRAEAWFKEKNI